MQRFVSLLCFVALFAALGRFVSLSSPESLTLVEYEANIPALLVPSTATTSDLPEPEATVTPTEESARASSRATERALTVFGFDEPTADSGETSQILYPAATGSTPPEAAATPDTDDPQTSTVLVVQVIDGDTVELENGERVRYIGIDTPESTTQHECYGEEAKQRNRELVEGKRVSLSADVEDRDKYGRLLRYVYLDDQFINLSLAEDGYASQLTIPPNVAHASEFREAVTRAREHGRGLWGACGGNGPSSSPRADYDQTVPQAASSECPADTPIKGNAQSMIYHLPSGEFYEKTKPEACFASEAEAEAAGYRRSKR